MKRRTHLFLLCLFSLGFTSSCKNKCPSPDTLQLKLKSQDRVFSDELSSLDVTITIDQVERRKTFELGTTLKDGETTIFVELPPEITAENMDTINIRVYGYTGEKLAGTRLATASTELNASSCNVAELTFVSSNNPNNNDAGTSSLPDTGGADSGGNVVSDGGNQTDGGSQADSGQADSGQADSGQADSGQADSGQADSGQTDSGQADSGHPIDSGSVDASTPDSGTVATYVLTVSNTGTGTGVVVSIPPGISCPGNCSASFAENTIVTLQPTPSIENGFSEWSGACEGHNGCTIELTANTQVSAEFEQGLVAFYALDGNTFDSSRNGYNGINMGATLAPGFRNEPDTAFEFTGTNVIQVMTSSPTSGFPELTLCAWFSLNSIVTVAPRFIVGNTNWGNNTADDPYALVVDNAGGGSNLVALYTYNDNGARRYVQKYYRTTFVENQWKHFCMVYNGTLRLYLYEDGTRVASAFANGPSPEVTTPIVLGNCNRAPPPTNPLYCDANNSLNGKLDNVKLYRRALNPAEITLEYNRR